MIEIGYRLASRLPLIFLCDLNSQGNVPDLPLNLQVLRVIGLPHPDPSDRRWVDPQPQRTIDRLVRRFRDEEEAGRILDSMHPVAAINAANAHIESPGNLYYTAASDVADDVFGTEFGDGRPPRLVGRTMEQFLASAQKRMHPNQWEAFARDQKAARSKLRPRNARLEPLDAPKPGIRVFLSYRSDTRANVLKVYNRLRELAPYIDPFIDVSMNKGDNWLEMLEEAITTSELCFLFLDDSNMGPGQEEEVNAIQARFFTRAGKKYPVVPVLLRPSAEVPLFLSTKQRIAFDELTESASSISCHITGKWWTDTGPLSAPPFQGRS
jgi:hypothetical protein